MLSIILADFLALHGISENIELPISFNKGETLITIDHYKRSGANDIVLYSYIADMPVNQELTIYKILMDANVLWSGTAGATIGVQSETKKIIIAYHIVMESIEGNKLAAIFTHFVELSTLWKKIIQENIYQTSSEENRTINNLMIVDKV